MMSKYLGVSILIIIIIFWILVNSMIPYDEIKKKTLNYFWIKVFEKLNYIKILIKLV